MPYCETHNEVYQAAECPKCAGDVEDAGDGTSTVDSDAAGEAEPADPVGDAVDRAMDAVEGGLADEVSGDIVVGSQEKSVSREESTEVDQSTTEVHDQSTTVSDSVVNRSDIGGGGEGATVDDSVVNRSDVGGSGGKPSLDAGGGAESTSGPPAEETEFCLYCGEEIPAASTTCPACGESLAE